MDFAIVCVIALVVLGVLAAVASYFQKGDDEVILPHDCASCSAVASGECKIGCLLEEKKRQKDNKKENKEL